MTEELKPCAHCGHPAEMWEDCDDSGIPFYNIGCSNCTIGTDWLYHRDDCIKAWNSRHDPVELPEWAKVAIEKEIFRLWAEYAKTGIPRLDACARKLEWVLTLRRGD